MVGQAETDWSVSLVVVLPDGEAVPAGWRGSTLGSWDVMLGEDWAMTERGVNPRVCVIAVR